MEPDQVLPIARRAARAVWRVPGTVLGVSFEDVVQAAAIRALKVAHRSEAIVYRAAKFGALDEVRRLSGRGDGRARRLRFPRMIADAWAFENLERDLVPDIAEDVAERLDLARRIAALPDRTAAAAAYLVAFADYSFTSASRVLGITPSGVTYAVRRLRRLLGVEAFRARPPRS